MAGLDAAERECLADLDAAERECFLRPSKAALTDCRCQRLDRRRILCGEVDNWPPLQKERKVTISCLRH